ncbi:MAG: GcrA family cell cycle regulator [Rhodobiaceae bacterium]|nr:GcrA family cell cycle regulator [Rhodobiaceae bacterium]
MSWTDERVELLRKLWTEGHSASQIAAQLGGVTRNAVIGKVHRLGLSGRGKSTRPSTARTKPQRTYRAPSRPTRSGPLPTVGNAALSVDIEEAPAPQPEARPRLQEVAPVSKKASIMQLTDRVCKWPIGDPQSPEFHFCGNDAQAGTPYCSYHVKVAYQPTTDRRQRKVVNG